MGHVVTFKNSTSIKVLDSIAIDVEARWAGRVKSQSRIRIPIASGGKVTVDLSSINGVYPEEIWDGMLHEKNGDWMCAQGQWHKKGYTCAHEPPKKPHVEPGQTILERIDKPPTGKVSDRNWDVMRRNIQGLKTGGYGIEGLSNEAKIRIEALRQKAKARQMEFQPMVHRSRKIVQAINAGDQ